MTESSIYADAHHFYDENTAIAYADADPIPRSKDSGIKSDSDGSPVAAGIAYDAGGEFLLVKRGNGGDYPGHWAFPGGHIEEGESPEQAAIREFHEETGGRVHDAISIGSDGHFETFYATGPKFDVRMCDESTGAIWTSLDALPEPMHPGCLAVLQSQPFLRIGLTEVGIAKKMASGALSSPQQYENVNLFSIRITGTGVCYRSTLGEFAWRDPKQYLNPGFLERCNGLPVIFEHPKDGVLDSKEFSKRVVGTVLYPFIKGDEVWAVAKIFDDGAVDLMRSERLSTSPSVVTDGDAKLILEDGQECTIEGKPFLIDHIAICEKGVWDKGGDPAGVSNGNNQIGVSDMTEEELKAKADAEAQEKEREMSALKADNEALVAKLKEYEDKAKADEEKAREEEEGKKAKADSDLREKIASLEAKLPAALSDADLEALAETQAKADSVFAAFGERAPRPMQGETPLAYRRRLAGKLKAHSKTYKDADISAADGALLDIAEKAIYADAFSAAAAPSAVPAGQLRQSTRQTRAGHTVIEWKGDSEAYLSAFAAKPQRVARFNTQH